MSSRSAQISVEFLIVVGLVLLMLSPLWFSLYRSVADEQETLKISSAKIALSRIARASELVYIQGYPAETTVVVSFPSGIVNYSLGNNETVLRISFKGTFLDVVEPSKTNVTGSLPTAAGLHRVRIRAEEGGYVNISSVS
ncbi:MAG: hypothetical protein V1820_04325 [archaeon]